MFLCLRSTWILIKWFTSQILIPCDAFLYSLWVSPFTDYKINVIHLESRLVFKRKLLEHYAFTYYIAFIN